jgi:excisionase family DNA binding protein
MDRLMSMAEVAEALNVCEETARNLVRSGRLASIRVGGQWRVRPRALEQYLDLNERYAAVADEARAKARRRKAA